MSAFIFGRLHCGNINSEAIAHIDFNQLSSICVLAGYEFDQFPNKNLLLRMLSHDQSWIDSMHVAPFVLLDKRTDDVSEGLLLNTPISISLAAEVAWMDFCSRIAVFFEFAHHKGVKRIELVMTVGYSIAGDFKHIFAKRSSLKAVLLEELQGKTDLPSLWIYCEI
jgi:hypothetical protein